MWVPFCAVRDLDPFVYNPRVGAQCLDAVQLRADSLLQARHGQASRSVAQHSQLKSARAAMNAIWQMWYAGTAQSGLDFAKDPLIASIAAGVRRTNPMTARYATTWDPNDVFAFVYQMAAQHGIFIHRMKYHIMRPWVMLFLRLKTKMRSGDICPVVTDLDTQGDFRPIQEMHGGIYRNFITPDAGPAAQSGPSAAGKLYGLKGSPMPDLAITDVRTFRNKTIANQPSHFSMWMPLGGYLQPSAAAPYLHALCVRRMIESYFWQTEDLARATDSLFLANRPVKGSSYAGSQYRAVGSQTASNDVGSVMSECGVPSHYLPHSVKHASVSAEVRGGKKLPEISESMGTSSAVLQFFYNRPVDATDVAQQLIMKNSTRGAIQGSRDPRLSKLADASAKSMLSGVRHDDPNRIKPLPFLFHVAGPRNIATERRDVVDTTSIENSQPIAEKQDPFDFPSESESDSDNSSDPDAFEVLNIVEHRIPKDDDGQPGSWDSAKQHVLFLVEWKNFPLRKDFTWEPLPNLGGCAALLAAYVGNSPALKNLFPEFFSEYPELD